MNIQTEMIALLLVNDMQVFKHHCQPVSVHIVVEFMLSPCVCLIEKRHQTCMLSKALLSITNRDPESDPGCVLALEHYINACDSGQEPWQAAVASFESCRPFFEETISTQFDRSHLVFATIAAKSQAQGDATKQCLSTFIENTLQYCHISAEGIGREEAAGAIQYLKHKTSLPSGQ